MPKALIIYASKTGTTEDAAYRLAAMLEPACDVYPCCKPRANHGNSSVHQIQSMDELHWEDYEVVVLGTAMYMGKPMKAFIDFCTKHEHTLQSKTLMLFTCGVGTQEEDQAYLSKHIPPAISERALQYRHLGGELREERMGFFARLAMKDYVKKHGPAAGVSHQLIEEMSTAIRTIFEKN